MVFRPADSVETIECYETALIFKNQVSALALSRQTLPIIRTEVEENKSARGGYILFEPERKRQITLIATGSEVSLALKAKDILEKKGIKTAVVSMPCVELFRQQPISYQDTVLGDTPRVIIEAGSSLGWYQFIGNKGGTVIGIDTFGASGKGPEVMAHFGFTPEHIVNAAEKLLKI